MTDILLACIEAAEELVVAAVVEVAVAAAEAFAVGYLVAGRLVVGA